MIICQNTVNSLFNWLSSQKKSINVTHQNGVLVVIVVLLQFTFINESQWQTTRILDSVHTVVDKPAVTLRQMSGKQTQHQNLHHGPTSSDCGLFSGFCYSFFILAYWIFEQVCRFFMTEINQTKSQERDSCLFFSLLFTVHWACFRHLLPP